jgi:hypothetical protein
MHLLAIHVYQKGIVVNMAEGKPAIPILADREIF